VDIVSAFVGISFLAAFVVFGSVLVWYQQGARSWESAAFPGEERAVARQVHEASSTFRAMSHPASDTGVERLRLKAHRRWIIMTFLVPSILIDPLLAGIVGVGLLRATQIGLVATAIVAFETVLIAAAIIQLGRCVIAFGNGGDVSVRRMALLTARIAVLAGVMSIQIVVLTR
jgi:hypothetical protein